MTGSSIPSPCIDVCRMHPATGWCEGCLRSLDEIAAWPTLDDRARRAVWKQLPARRAEFIARTSSPRETPTP